jgi:hypothetical protein
MGRGSRSMDLWGRWRKRSRAIRVVGAAWLEVDKTTVEGIA